ncbi:unnamed protein product, partial [Mesorhabditis belari]|uniref:Uncharacterized protein n=1 Tax=Mesorhabditis belari TaxID=2138241 RepID=A0AAF3FR77_9BILA
MEPSSSTDNGKKSSIGNLSANLTGGMGYQNFQDVPRLKLVVVGDSYTGKTSLLYSYTEQRFVTKYDTTVFDNFAVNINIEGKRYLVNLFDTAGQEDYAHLRTLSYPQANVFLLCFSMVDGKTLDAAQITWMPEIRKYTGQMLPVLPVILVGTKEDLWEKEPETQRLSLEKAEKIAQEMGCISFIPCSALTQRGLKRVFDEAFLAGTGALIKNEAPPPLCCSIL